MSNWKWKPAYYRLKTLAKKCHAERRPVTLHKVSSIGLLYHLNDNKMPEAVLSWQKELLDIGKNVKTLGFFDGKTLPSDCSPNEKNDFFCRKDLNILGIVKDDQIRHFLSQPFELLLNVYTEPMPAMLSVSVYSKALLRIGPYFPEFTDCFDLMLEQKNENDIESLIEEMKLRLKGVLA